MKTDIDPRVDYAFKRIFGAERSIPVLTDFLRAVLKTGNQTLVDLWLLNPFNDKDFANDKLSILDIKARDASGRHLNIEMQLCGSLVLLQRILYYWAGLHVSQLTEGDDYAKLRQTISVVILDTSIFPVVDEHHHHFQIRSATRPELVFCPDLSMYVIELPKFRLGPDQLNSDLDVWCYFLKHGKDLDKSTLPASLNSPFVVRALEEMEMMSQSEIEREHYQARLKWERDQKCLFAAAVAEACERATAEVREKIGAEVREKVSAEVREKVSAEVREKVSAEVREKVSAEVREKVSAEVRAEALAQGKLISRIQTMQEALGLNISSDDELIRLSQEELQRRVANLKQQTKTR